MTSCIHRRDLLKWSLAATAAPALCGCVATNAATGRSSFTGLISVEDDIRIGRQEAPKLVKQFGGVYDNPRLQRYVEQIGRKAAAYAEYQQYPYTFTIVNSPTVNAFALPGGPVFVTRGLVALASSEAELAGVISHELGHVNARHSAERQSQGLLAQLGAAAVGIAAGGELGRLAAQGAAAYITSYSRDQEFEADKLGVRYMSRASYDPDKMASFLDSLRDHSKVEAKMMGLPPGKVDEFNINATHPRTVERVKAAANLSDGLRPANPIINRQQHLDQINGLIYGDDPEQGIVHGRRFSHPGLRFEFEVPSSFRLINRPDKVIGQSPDQDLIIFDMAKAPTRASMKEYIRTGWAPRARLSDLEAIEVNGLPAATAATSTSRGMDVRLVAMRGSGETVYRLAFLTKPSRTSRMAHDFRVTTYSFRRLSQAEAAKIRPHRLIVVPIHPGDRIESLASGMPFGKFNVDAFRVLNDLKPGQPLPESGQVKVVVA